MAVCHFREVSLNTVCMPPEAYFAAVFKSKDQSTEQLCVARRSTFWLENEPLLLTEIFLPDLKLFL